MEKYEADLKIIKDELLERKRRELEYIYANSKKEKRMNDLITRRLNEEEKLRNKEENEDETKENIEEDEESEEENEDEKKEKVELAEKNVEKDNEEKEEENVVENNNENHEDDEILGVKKKKFYFLTIAVYIVGVIIGFLFSLIF